MQKFLLGQGSSLHALVSSPSPVHDSPPKAGGGLVQVLDLFCTPPPQVTEQLLQSFQLDQLPSTKKFQDKGESYVAFPQENYKKYVWLRLFYFRKDLHCTLLTCIKDLFIDCKIRLVSPHGDNSSSHCLAWNLDCVEKRDWFRWELQYSQ